jgi:DNA-binding MarR family transcriptional regulator
MVDMTPAADGGPGSSGLSEEALETSHLLVGFLHAAYSTRHLDAAATASAEATRDGPARGHAAVSLAASTHAVRAAIHVYQHGERTVGQLASGLGVSYGWASRIVDELETAGYVMRERDANDRRIVRVRLSPQRIEAVAEAYQWRGRAVEKALEPLSPSDREAVRSFLRRVAELLLADQSERP